ncbi:MAG: hypothetical protein ACI9MS_002802 [Glaciecola sp.]|jgi:uncharacterized protein YcbX
MWLHFSAEWPHYYGKIMTPQVSQLFVYPIKSCAGISVSSFKFDEKGPLFDRRWMLVDSKTGVFLSQRSTPKMALISTRLENEEVWVGQSLDNDLIESCRLPIKGEQIEVEIWSDQVRGYDCGDELALWFSQLLKHDCRLVYQGDCRRMADEEYADKETSVSFADGFPLLVVAQASIDVLNEACEAKISATNFRPNIVIKNTPAFAEKKWKKITVESDGFMADNLEMAVVKSCERCIIPMLNPYTAEREKSILPVLLEYCRDNKKIIFGQNLTFKYFNNVYLTVGQTVAITD